MVPVASDPVWTILVPTIGERRALFGRLMDVLLPQITPHGGQVQVLGYWNNGNPPLPEIRQRMVEAVDTDYLCCVDDDDLVPPYYVTEVLAALDDRPDYVGFQVQCYSDGAPTAISHHDLANGRWWNETHAYYRDFSHINPIRSELAKRVDYRLTRPGAPEDRAWVQQLRDLDHDWHQVLIDKVMYHYLFSTSRTAGMGSRWKRPDRIRQRGYRPLEVHHPYFRWYPGCLEGVDR